MQLPLVNRVLDHAIAIQQIPAPTFHEDQRVAFLYQQFLSEGLSDVTRDDAGNLFARLPGIGGAAPLVVSAHCDTVFPASTDLHIRREPDRIFGPGIGDNSLGIAGLFGLLWMLREREVRLPGDLWLVANVGEEGLGDLCGMRAVVDRFGDQALAYLVLEGMALGQVYNRGLGVRRYQISVRTLGGHSWVDYGRESAVHELAKLVNQLLALPLPREPRTTLNVGVIAGGTTVNTIAAQAHLELDLRSESVEALAVLVAQVDTLVAVANHPGVQVSAEVIGSRPAGSIPDQHPLVQLALSALRDQGLEARTGIGSTDANIPLSRGISAICTGISTGGNAHTTEEFINTQPVGQGLEHLFAIVRNIYK